MGINKRIAIMGAAIAGICTASINAEKITTTDIDIKIYNVEKYYKARFERPQYCTCSYRFDEIKKIDDLDLTKYSKTVYQTYGGKYADNAIGVINDWDTQFDKEYRSAFKEVATAGKSVNYNQWYETHAEDENDIYRYDAPYQDISLEYAWYNTEAKVICMMYNSTTYNGGGMGASYETLSTPFYYDFRLERALQMSDLFTGEYQQKMMESVKMWLEYRAGEICLQTDLEQLTLSKNWEIRQDCIMIIYPKYEIACGAAGNVEVPVYAYDLQECLTPLAKKLMGVKGE